MVRGKYTWQILDDNSWIPTAIYAVYNRQNFEVQNHVCADVSVVELSHLKALGQPDKPISSSVSPRHYCEVHFSPFAVPDRVL